MNLIIIPSLEPDIKLIKLINDLKEEKLDKILVIDDGTKDQTIFNQLDVPIIHHKQNKGKGDAIKTAIKEYDKYYKNISGFITVDSDGQHTIKDIKRIDSNLKDNIILGVRNFNEENVPLRSKIGNKFSSLYFFLTTHTYLQDTQTGLRGIPIKYKDILLNTEGDRFEYEMNFLYKVIDSGAKIDTIQIETVYEKKNHKSHFHTFSDSYRIYKDLFRYIIVSLISAIIDIGLFTLLLNTTIKTIFLATIIARILSGIFNFLMNKNIVFNSKSKNSFIKYIILFITQMILSGLFTTILDIIPINTIIIKIIVDLILFIASFIIQKTIIFKKTN